MAFHEIDLTPAKAGAADQTGISVSLVKLRGKPALLRVLVRKSVMDAMEWTGDEALALLVGTDDDHGMVRLQKNKGGKGRLTERRAMGGAVYWQISCGRLSQFVDRQEKPEACRWEKLDLTTLEIVLPKWADETRPRKLTEQERQHQEHLERRKRMGMTA